MPLRTEDYVAIHSAIGHTFLDSDLILEAMDTTSLRTAEPNQRLAMLGDALLKMILLDEWYAGGSAKGMYTISSPPTGCWAWLTVYRARSGLDSRQQRQPGHDRTGCWNRQACYSSSRTHR